jgi:hypothetical protein
MQCLVVVAELKGCKMKVFSQSIYVLIILFLAVACAPTATVTQQVPTVAPQTTSAEKYHSLDTRTGIEEIDIILAAVENRDPQSLRDLFRYNRVACMTVNALGGPPPCREGEAEGTSVEVLPFLGSEGFYLWKDAIGSWPGLDVDGLYAVYQVSDTAYSDEYYPKGEYGVILINKEGRDESVVLQIKDGGIVRIDYIFDLSSDALTGILERSAAEIVLAPIE